MRANRARIPGGGWLLLFGAVLVALSLTSLGIGRFGVPLSQILDVLGLPGSGTWSDATEAVILRIRLPRVLLAMLVGASLSAAGAAYQGVFRNPMAAPDLLGASSGAAFGAALAIHCGAGTVGIAACAFVASLAGVGFVGLIAARAPGKKVVTLILAGVMIGSLFSAGTSYIKLVADPSDQLPAITYWMMGSLAGSAMRDVRFAAIPMALGLIPLLLLRWRLNLLTLGDDEARTMGVDAGRLRLLVVFCATLVTAASVSVSGLIGWVGLVVPHLCRRLVGNDYRVLMPASLLLGAAFLLGVDDVSRTLLATEIPIGILTAFIGAPFFLSLLLRKGTTA